jgi:hypothetical protein
MQVVAAMPLLVPPALFWVILTVANPSGNTELSNLAAAVGESIFALLLGLAYMQVGGTIRSLHRGSILQLVSPFVRTLVIFYLGLGLALFSILYLSFFMYIVYPRIPVQFGGGSPRVVELLFKPDALEGAKALGIPLSSKPNLSAPLELSYEGSDSYIIRPAAGIVVQLDKKW